MCVPVNQSVYMLSLKQRDLQLGNSMQRYWRGFMRRTKVIFLKIYLLILNRVATQMGEWNPLTFPGVFKKNLNRLYTYNNKSVLPLKWENEIPWLFSDFLVNFSNSPTFLVNFRIPRLFPVFQVAWQPWSMDFSLWNTEHIVAVTLKHNRSRKFYAIGYHIL